MSERDLPDLPELPSDEELGIAGLDEEELLGDTGHRGKGGAPPPQNRGPADSRPPAPRRGGWVPAVAAVVVLVGGSWAMSANRSLPSTVPANALDTVFSSSRAMSQLVEIARAPRPVGAPEHTRVRELILDRLVELGLEPQVQTSLSLRRRGQTVRAVTLRNVLARIPGTASSGAVLLTTHYDAVPVSHGAGDAGTGVAALLETVRALVAGPPLENDVILLLTDGEELGLLGARAFLEEHPWMDDVAVVLSVEMRGGGGPSIMFETGAENGWIVEAMNAGDPRPMAHSVSVEVYRRLPNNTDFTPFREAGIQGLNFAGIADSWIYHQATDVPENVSEATLQHHGMRILGITRELGRRDLGQVHAPDRIHFVVPVLGLVHFPVAWMLPGAATVLLLWVGVAVLAFVRGAGGFEMLAGFGLSVLAIAVTAGVGWGLMRWLPRFHPEFGHMNPAFYGEGWYVLALAALGVAVVTLLFGLGRRRFSLSGLSAGAVALPVIGGVVASVLTPMAAVVLVGPALAGVMTTGVAAVVGRSDERVDRAAAGPSYAVWIAGLALALPVLALLVPVIQLLWVAMSFRLAVVLGGLVVVTLLCMLPGLEALSSPNRWWAPLAAFAVAGACLAGGILLGGPSDERPLPSTLIYAMERTAVEAEVGAESSGEEPLPGDEPPPGGELPPAEEPAGEPAEAPAQGSAYWVSRPDPGLAWAREQAGSLEEGVPLDRFLLPDGLPAGAAPLVDVPPPVVRVVQWREPAEVGAPASVRLAIHSRVGAELVTVEVTEGDGIVPVALNARPFPAAVPGSPGSGRPVTLVRHLGVPEGEIVLDLDVTSGEGELRITVIEQHSRASELVGAEPFRRPPGLIPSSGSWHAGGASDRAILRTPVRILAPAGEPALEEPTTADPPDPPDPNPGRP